MPCTIVAGGQWGDEAKGKICAYLALQDDIFVSARAGLGPGAGHTVVHQGLTYRFRQVPAAAVNPKTRLLLGAGVLVSPRVLLHEIEEYGLQDRLAVDYRATVIDDAHVEQEHADAHLVKIVESTGNGHGPALAARAMRSARLARDVPELQPYLADVAEELNLACDRGRSVLLEGTNGALLSVLYGTYPHTVGKDCTASSIAADAGLGPLRVDEVVLVLKTFPTRVGGGDFPTEMTREEIERLGYLEYGTVTGRPRRVGRFDIDAARLATRLNHPSQIALTFLDRVDAACRGSTSHLGEAAEDFVQTVARELNLPVSLLGTGPDVFEIIDRRPDPAVNNRRPAVPVKPRIHLP